MNVHVQLANRTLMFSRAAFISWLLAVPLAAASPACRCFPSDACWPSNNVWSQFNKTIDGRLVKTVPLGVPCHAPNYNAETCEVLKDGWLLPEEQYVALHIPDSLLLKFSAHL